MGYVVDIYEVHTIGFIAKSLFFITLNMLNDILTFKLSVIKLNHIEQ